MQPSPRDANTVFATFNNYQRGDFKPYVYKSADRGRTWTSIIGDLPARSGAWSIVQDHVNGNLLFAGMEFGVWFTVDGGAHWMQLKGGIPTTQARDSRFSGARTISSSARSAAACSSSTTTRALRDLTPQSLTEEARLFPLRDAYIFDELGQQQAAWGNVSTPNPPYGAIFTYNVGQAPAADAKLVMNISDDGGRQVRRLELSKESGVHRIAWNLRGDPPAQRDTTDAGGRGGRGGRGGGAGGDAGAGGDDQEQPAQLVGRGGQPQGPPAAPGRYRAVIAKVSGETVTPIGQPQTFTVIRARYCTGC